MSKLTGLTNLQLENPAVDLTSLRPLMKLQRLLVDRPATADLSPLTGTSEMTELTLEGAGISDLRPLARMTKMDNQISDVSPLAGLSQILRLHLSGNQISNVTPLAGLLSLEKLQLMGNRITDLSSLTSLATRTWAGRQEIRVKAENGSRYTLPTLRDATGTKVPWQYPAWHPSAGTPVPSGVPVGQTEWLHRYDWEGTPFSGEFTIDVTAASGGPAVRSTRAPRGAPPSSRPPR